VKNVKNWFGYKRKLALKHKRSMKFLQNTRNQNTINPQVPLLDQFGQKMQFPLLNQYDKAKTYFPLLNQCIAAPMLVWVNPLSCFNSYLYRNQQIYWNLYQNSLFNL